MLYCKKQHKQHHNLSRCSGRTTWHYIDTNFFPTTNETPNSVNCSHVSTWPFKSPTFLTCLLQKHLNRSITFIWNPFCNSRDADQTQLYTCHSLPWNASWHPTTFRRWANCHTTLALSLELWIMLRHLMDHHLLAFLFLSFVDLGLYHIDHIMKQPLLQILQSNIPHNNHFEAI